MNKKSIFISCFLSLIIMGLFFVNEFYVTTYVEATNAYQVYLNGEKLGLIENRDDLYTLINNEQQEIKDKYGVDNVYPPSGLDIVEVNTYNNNVVTVGEIYSSIANADDFTVKGYKVTIKYDENEYYEDGKVPDDRIIYVLNKDIFEKAIKNLVFAFVNESEYENYINNINTTIDDVGTVINKMFFRENISIKEEYISVKNKIYTENDITELTQYLLLGENAQKEEYVVKEGDTIASISEAYELNPKEFLITNPQYRAENTLLKIGSTVNVSLINPLLTFVYNVYEIKLNEVLIEKKVIEDTTKAIGYSEVVKPGVTGLNKDYQTYEVVNGESSSGVTLIDRVQIREMVPQEVVVGKKFTGGPVNIAGNWGWATNSGYIITSPFGKRWGGQQHDGMDISGPGRGSPIYSIGDGVVVEAETYRVTSYRKDGTFVVIQHANNVFSLYAHLDSRRVNVGDTVKKGDVIGTMGETGFAKGVHLHLSVSYGWPFHGSYQFINPMGLYQ